MNIQIQNAYQCVGIVEKATSTNEFTRLQRLTDQNFGLMFVWPAALELRFLSIEVARPNGENAFLNGFPALENVAAVVGFDINRFQLEQRKLVSGSAVRGETLRLAVRIDTDDSQYKAWCDRTAAAGSPFVLAVQVVRFFGSAFEQDTLGIVLSDGAPPAFAGFAAIDLGNTTSSLAVLQAGDQSDNIKFPPDVPYSKAASASLGRNHTTPSVLSVDEVYDMTSLSPPKQVEILAQRGTIRWSIGDAAQRGHNPGSLILGPKRRASRPFGDPFEVLTERIVLPDVRPGSISVRLPPTLPAELFIARQIQIMQSVGRCRVGRVAMTYPTSYSSLELKTLRSACARAVRRANFEQDAAVDERNERDVEQYVPLALDEATAAAFYFLNREVFEKAGGVRRFRYLYPRGFNLLVYDCGGGTTDICLVRAEAPSASQLKVSVLGRAGEREFGGDEITVWVFRLLKSRLALLISDLVRRDRDERRARFPQLQAGGDRAFSDQVRQWYLQHGDWVDEVVPLRPVGDHGDDARVREAGALELWRIAEKIKHNFAAGDKADKQKLQLEDGHLLRYLARLHFGSEKTDDKRKLSDAADRCEIQRTEIDALIVAAVRSTVRLCNKLIRKKLWKDGTTALTENSAGEFAFNDNEVHQVCLAGNGCRYGLISKLLREELFISFLDDDQRFMFDEANPHDLKNAVAKGAVLALASQEGRLGIHVEFESRLFELLPFDVGYRDFTARTCNQLFREGESYSTMTDERIYPVAPPPPEAAERARYVFLDRRWPGDDAWEPFLRFQFDRPISGDVTVAFDDRLHDFVVRNGGREGRKLPPEGDDESHLHPIQRRYL